MSMSREKAVMFLKNEPVKFGHMLGFTRLGNIHNEWIKDMVAGREDRTLEAHRG